LDLLVTLENLPADALIDPEAALYAGGAELAMVASLELNPFGVDLTPDEVALALGMATANIEYGLSGLAGDELIVAQQWASGLAASFGEIAPLVGDSLAGLLCEGQLPGTL